MDPFDYIVVGAGSAGSVLAGRLAARAPGRVLVLEAGPSDTSPWVHLPIGYGKLFYHKRLNWRYYTQPVPGLAGRQIYQPRGKVVGGSSAINAMVYARGQAEDFDAWAALGNPGWGWAEVLASYRRIERHALGETELHGGRGPVTITDITRMAHPLTAVFLAAGQQAGLALNPDLNGISCEGVGTYQITTARGRRVSAARAYLWPARRRDGLTVQTEALATRILFEGRRAVGVEYRQHGALHRAFAAREVILSAGAFNTPQLLQLSGIGPAALLRAHGIAVVADRPAVGRNLQDHLCYDHVYRSRRPSLNDTLLSLSGRARAALQYALFRAGPLALSVNQGGGFWRSAPEVARPDIQLYFSPLSYERAKPGVRALMRPDPFSGFSTSVSPCRPTSRGHVAIASADPAAPPEIVPNYLATDQDAAAMLAGARFLRRLAATEAFAALIAAELKPGPDVSADADLLADVRARAYSVFHPCGTCRMGPAPAEAVVDARLRVYGIGGLRVADASIFPLIPSGNINAPSMMVGERAADLIGEG